MVVVATICSVNHTYTVQTAGDICFPHQGKNMFVIHIVVNRINHQQFELCYVLDLVNLTSMLYALCTVTAYTG